MIFATFRHFQPAKGETQKKKEKFLALSLLLYNLLRLLDFLLMRNAHLLMADDQRKRLLFTKCMSYKNCNFISTVEDKGKIKQEENMLHMVNLSPCLFPIHEALFIWQVLIFYVVIFTLNQLNQKDEVIQLALNF